MPHKAVSAELIRTTQFLLPRTVATVLNQGIGYGFNIKIRVFFGKLWIFYALLRRRWCILLWACLLIGLYTLIADSQLLVKCIIQSTWLLRPQLRTHTVLKIFIVLQTREGVSSSLPTLLLRGDVYFHKDFNCYICIDAAAAEWHIPWYGKYKIQVKSVSKMQKAELQKPFEWTWNILD